MNSNLPEIPSPCVGICKLDAITGFCSGCLRSRDEIKAWRGATNDERLLILQDLKERRKKHGRVSESDLRPRRRARKQPTSC
ncbi:MAG: DUF1289 domain-containing protein [Alphaproteobacteria bacterium]|nr:DUF1289 domain-containing protein [Alphaproteobacteria bacterium]